MALKLRKTQQADILRATPEANTFIDDIVSCIVFQLVKNCYSVACCSQAINKPVVIGRATAART